MRKFAEYLPVTANISIMSSMGMMIIMGMIMIKMLKYGTLIGLTEIVY